MTQTSPLPLSPPARVFGTAARFGFPTFPLPAMQGSLQGALPLGQTRSGTKAAKYAA